jgi:hypothetical protein
LVGIKGAPAARDAKRFSLRETRRMAFAKGEPDLDVG